MRLRWEIWDKQDGWRPGGAVVNLRCANRCDYHVAFFAALDERFAPIEVDWSVSTQMLGYPDVPSHEAFMPNFTEANAANGEFGSTLWTTPDLDLQAEVDAHVERLQGVFDEAG